MNIKFFKRLCKISFVFAKYRIDSLLVSIPFFRTFRFFTLLNPKSWFPRSLTPGESLCLALEELGPVFIKFGQALSTRKDLLPKDITYHLSRLQDKVKPFSSDEALAILHAEYQKNISEVFTSFDTKPYASASIAQVHLAHLGNNIPAVVKIVRPNIKKTITRDIHVMYTIAGILEKHWAESDRIKPREIVAEFEQTILDELDMMREAANASLLKRNYHHSPELYVPEVFWDVTTKNILVTEKISGIPISQIDALLAKKIDLKRLAETGINIFFTQVFEHGFFHADMHPGNIFVNPEKIEHPQYMAVDFGIMGSLTDSDKRYLAQNLLAFFNRDYRQVALLHIESGWVPKETRVDAFESAIRTVAEPIFEKPLKEVSFGKIVVRLFQTARSFKMEVQPQLILLQKTLLAVEGLGRELYPDLNLWLTAKPFLERWVKKELGPKRFLNQMAKHLPYVANQLPTLPNLVIDALESQKSISRSLQALTQEQSRSRKPYLVGFAASLVTLPIIYWLMRDLFHTLSFETIACSSISIGVMLLALSKIRS